MDKRIEIPTIQLECLEYGSNRQSFDLEAEESNNAEQQPDGAEHDARAHEQ